MIWKVDKNTVWEDTGKVIVYNFPAQSNTYSYIVRIYREYKKGETTYREIEGDPIYFFDLPSDLRTLAIILGNASNQLSESLFRESFLKQITKDQMLKIIDNE